MQIPESLTTFQLIEARNATALTNCAIDMNKQWLAQNKPPKDKFNFQPNWFKHVNPDHLKVVDVLWGEIRFFKTSSEPFGLIIYDTSNNHVCVAFRGTQTTLNVWVDVRTKLVDFLYQPNFGKVHNGFQKLYATLRDSLMQGLGRIPADKRRFLFFTGHSLGAALGTLASVDLISNFREWNTPIYLYTTGCPKVGDSKFAENFGKVMQNNAFRIINSFDPIPNLPKNTAYLHVGQVIQFSAQYKAIQNHHPYECYYYAIYNHPNVLNSGIGNSKNEED